MPEYRIQKSFDRCTSLSDKCVAAMRMFGLTKERLGRIGFKCECTVSIQAGDIVYITGPSGSGKTVILNELQKTIGSKERINLCDIDVPGERVVVDCIEADLIETLKYFSIAGLADCTALLNTLANLSEGQQWRFRLGMALSAKRPFVFADEFCSTLDRITATCIAHNIRKFADRCNTAGPVTFILASAHQDILADLLPDVIVTCDLSNNIDVTYKLSERARGFSFCDKSQNGVPRKSKCRPAP